MISRMFVEGRRKVVLDASDLSGEAEARGALRSRLL